MTQPSTCRMVGSTLRILCAILGAMVLFRPNQVRADPVLAEFMADNQTGLGDEDGDDSDWIEIFNPGPAPVNLDQWHLTDDAHDLTRWAFPAVTLETGGSLVVFASGKNRRVAGAELHTNFKLAREGEYLGLVRPDGSTVADEFSPSYPPQFPDLSYGISVSATERILVQEGDPALARVPDAAYHAATSNDWRSVTGEFDESSWTPGVLGVGFERSNGFEDDIGLDVESAMYNQNGSVYVRIPFGPVTRPSDVVHMVLRMKYDDGFAAFLNGVQVADADAPFPLAYNSLSTAGRADDDAELFEDHDISAFAPLLSTTTNLLAIHGLNRTVGSSDLLQLPELRIRLRDESQAESRGFLSTPTPGAVNQAATFPGVIEDTRFAVGRGFYTNAISETITCTEPGATLIYTLNGSEPSLAHGIQVPAPDPLTAPTAHLSIATTTTLRVRAVKGEYLPSNVDTQTYLFPGDVVHQTGAGYPLPPDPSTSDWDFEMDPNIIGDPRFSRVDQDLLTLPTLSVVMDTNDLWGVDGVYSNPLKYGFDWEAACSVEYLRTDGTPGFQEDGGIRIQGSGSRRRPWSKKSMRLVFRTLYGAGKLDYPLFGERGARKIDNIVLRGDYFDSWTVHVEGSAEGIARSNAMVLRDEYGRQTHDDMGARPVIQGGWAHLYLNGMYWGVYNLHERPDQHFAEDRFGGDEDEYDVLKHKGPEVVSGDRVAWDRLMTTVKGDTTDPSVYASVRDQLDVDAFADYLVMNFWGGNNDWPHNNWYAMRHRPSNGPFTFVAWDVEHYIYITRDTGPIHTSTDQSPGIIWSQLRRNPEFKLYFADRVHRHMFNDGALTPARCTERFQNIVDTVHDAMNAEAARWGDTMAEPPYNTVDHFDTVVADKINHYFPDRTAYVLERLIAGGYYPATAAPEFARHGGQIPEAYVLDLTHPGGAGTVYVTTDGSDPRLTGGTVNPLAVSGTTLVLQGTTRVKARVLNGSEWSALTEADFIVAEDPAPGALVIPEFNYHPSPPSETERAAGFGDGEAFEYLELLNVSPQAVDLTAVAFAQGIRLDFGTLLNPDDRVLAPDERILLVADTNAFHFRHGTNAAVAVPYDGNLNNGGETLALTQGTNQLISFSYDDRSPWPESPDGDGPSLVLRQPHSQPDHGDPLQWRPSGFHGGSPGQSGPPEPAYPTDAHGDDNTNGVPNLVEYAVADPLSLYATTTDSNTVIALRYARHLLADQTRIALESTTDLQEWSALTNGTLAAEIHHNDGTATYILHAPDLDGSDPIRSFRLNLVP